MPNVCGLVDKIGLKVLVISIILVLFVLWYYKTYFGKEGFQFDSNFYIKQYPDVAKSKEFANDPLKHYMTVGKKEGRIGFFDADFYLWLYPDVAEDPTYSREPLKHYIDIGRKEGRYPAFDSDFYLNKYSDVAEHPYFGMHPLCHFRRLGVFEDRVPFDLEQ